MGIDLMWGIGAVIGWYASSYVYNHFVAPAIEGGSLMGVLTSTIDESYSYNKPYGDY